ncbi:MAG: ABC transporter substrate-binding protein, partial [Acidimicrobiales bacterium]
MSRSRLRLAACAAAVALLAATSSTVAATAQGSEPVLAAPLVRFPFPQEDGSLTPYTFELGYSLMTLVYDTLLWRDVEGVPQPWLAETVDTSPDGRQVTIRLREGATWHDGVPVTSADVAFTFGHVADRPHPRFTGEVSQVERVDTPDPRTAVISLSAPAPGFGDQPLADLPILPRHLWRDLPADKLAPDGLPVGSGPYRLVEHVPDERYRFEANEWYFRGKPAVDVLEVPIIRTANETVRALERRDVDMIPASLPEDLARRADTLSLEVLTGPSYVGTVLLLNVRTPPFDRPDVRQAVARALDLSRIARTAGTAVPADHGYLHPESAFASPDVVHAVDVEAARPVLAALGAPIVVLVPDNDPVKSDAGRQVVQSLLGAGATAEVQQVPRDQLDQAIGFDGGDPTFQAAVVASPPLASHDPVFLSRLFGTGAPFNYSGYSSPAFDEAAGRVATTADPEQRLAATWESLQILAADAPVIPLFFAEGAFAYRPAAYDGWVYVKGAGILDKRSFVEPGSGR